MLKILLKNRIRGRNHSTSTTDRTASDSEQLPLGMTKVFHRLERKESSDKCEEKEGRKEGSRERESEQPTG